MLIQADSERPVDSGAPALIGHLGEALWVHNGHDREGHAAVRQVSAAGAPVIRQLHFEEIFVGDVLAVGGRLHASHHELVLLGDLLLHTLLFLGLLHLVLDL